MEETDSSGRLDDDSRCTCIAAPVDVSTLSSGVSAGRTATSVTPGRSSVTPAVVITSVSATIAVGFFVVDP